MHASAYGVADVVMVALAPLQNSRGSRRKNRAGRKIAGGKAGRRKEKKSEDGTEDARRG
jgi:hypothetical protein